jgi:cytochrome P450
LRSYETTGSTLHFAIWLLALFPEFQERLREEISQVMGDSEEITFDHLRRMHFLRAIVQETLRIFPIAPT